MPDNSSRAPADEVAAGQRLEDSLAATPAPDGEPVPPGDHALTDHALTDHALTDHALTDRALDSANPADLADQAIVVPLDDEDYR